MRFSFILSLFILISKAIYPCDYCNCYLGLNPNYKKNLVGLRNHFSQYSGSHYSDYDLQGMNLSQEDFWEMRNSVELHAQYYPSDKLQLLFSMPYFMNKEEQSSEATAALNNTGDSHTGHSHTHVESNTGNPSEPIRGIGDPLILAHYQIFNRVNLDSNSFSHRMLAGGGIKIPLGDYSLNESSDPLERVHMPGSGSWDLLASTTYLARLRKFGTNLNVSYLFTNSNDEEFEFGNRLNVNGVVYYRVDANWFLIYPNLGINYERADMDIYQGKNVYGTGGEIYYLQSGMDIYFNHFSINMSLQVPISIDLNPYQPEMEYKIVTGLTYTLN